MEVFTVRILKTLGMIVFLFVFCSCAEREASHKDTQGSLYPKEAPIAFLQYLEETLEARRFQVENSGRYRDFFGADREWSRKGNILPVRLIFLPSQTQRHMYIFEGYVADTKQDNGDIVLISLRGAVPQGDTVPTLTVSTAKVADLPNPLPNFETLNKLQQSLFARIDQGAMTWEAVTAPPLHTSPRNPYTEWRRERFLAEKRTPELSRSDLTLTQISSAPNSQVRFSFSVAPLMANAGNNRVMLSILSFNLDRNGRIFSTDVSAEVIPLSYMTLQEITPEDRSEISRIVLHNLFAFQLPSGVRRHEKVRFCYPAPGSDKSFYDEKLRKDAVPPERSPFVRDPQLPVPFDEDKKAYTTLEDGAFHYNAGFILPVDDSVAYVFSATLAYSGALSRPEIAMRFTKGFFGWKPTRLWVHHPGSPAKQ